MVRGALFFWIFIASFFFYPSYSLRAIHATAEGMPWDPWVCWLGNEKGTRRALLPQDCWVLWLYRRYASANDAGDWVPLWSERYQDAYDHLRWCPMWPCRPVVTFQVCWGRTRTTRNAMVLPLVPSKTTDTEGDKGSTRVEWQGIQRCFKSRINQAHVYPSIFSSRSWFSCLTPFRAPSIRTSFLMGQEQNDVHLDPVGSTELMYIQHDHTRYRRAQFFLYMKDEWS